MVLVIGSFILDSLKASLRAMRAYPNVVTACVLEIFKKNVFIFVFKISYPMTYSYFLKYHITNLYKKKK